jgi:hypothetical protein
VRIFVNSEYLCLTPPIGCCAMIASENSTFQHVTVIPAGLVVTRQAWRALPCNVNLLIFALFPTDSHFKCCSTRSLESTGTRMHCGLCRRQLRRSQECWLPVIAWHCLISDFFLRELVQIFGIFFGAAYNASRR